MSQNKIKRTEKERVPKDIAREEIAVEADYDINDNLKEREIKKEEEEQKKEEEEQKKKTEYSSNKFSSAAGATSQPLKSYKSERLTKVEKILEEDLEEIYFKMPPEAQRRFKLKGEEVSLKIEEMFKAGKVIAKKILLLIRSWLKIIPGINKFFLEQEAKIKTDKIMRFTDRDDE